MVTEFIVDQQVQPYSETKNQDSIFKKIKKLEAVGVNLPICKPCREDFQKSNTKCGSAASTRDTLENGEICINRVRLNRNGWIHDHAEISDTAAIEAIRISEALIKNHYDVVLTATVTHSAAVW